MKASYRLHASFIGLIYHLCGLISIISYNFRGISSWPTVETFSLRSQYFTVFHSIIKPIPYFLTECQDLTLKNHSKSKRKCSRWRVLTTWIAFNVWDWILWNWLGVIHKRVFVVVLCDHWQQMIRWTVNQFFKILFHSTQNVYQVPYDESKCKIMYVSLQYSWLM